MQDSTTALLYMTDYTNSSPDGSRVVERFWTVSGQFQSPDGVQTAFSRTQDHRTNTAVLNEISADRQFVATITKQKLQYFGHMIRARNLCTHVFELDATRSRGRPRRR